MLNYRITKLVRIIVYAAAISFWIIARASVFAADASTPVPRVPPGSVASPLLVMGQLKAGSDAVGPGTTAIVFDGPSGDGRSGAKGLLFKALRETDHTWTFRYSVDASAFPLQIIHNHRGGQVIVHLGKNGVGVSSPSNWIGVGYGLGDETLLEKTEAFAKTFPLKPDVEYIIASRKGGRGRYEMVINGQTVVYGTLEGFNSLSLEIPAGKTFPQSGPGALEFKGPDLPLHWERGWAALFLGPVDGGTHVCRDIRYFSELVDASGRVVPIPARPEVATTTRPLEKTASPSPAQLAPFSLSSATNAADLVKTNRSNLVFVTTPDGAGSGFIASYGTGTFLVTNAHVAAGARGAMFKTLDGTQVQIGAPAAAVGHDIFLMALKAGSTPFQVMTGVDQNASIGDEIVVLGNAEGAGVINTIQGKIVGLGPNLVEVDAPFQPGNSGSPIIHLKTGKVVGVATYLTIRKFDSATKEAVKDPIIRRFGYRLDSVKNWQPVNWQNFYAQAAEMESIEKLTNDLVAFLQDLGKDGRVNRGAHTNPVIKTRIDQWIEAKSKRLSPRDASTADQSMISFLKVTCQSDVTAAQQRLTYDYFQRQLADQQRERTELAGVFSKIIDNLRQ